MIVDPEAAVVRRVFALFARGYGKTAIARILNEEGIPNSNEAEQTTPERAVDPGGAYP